MKVFGRRTKRPDKAFVHQEGCRILRADPDVLIEWQEVERGFWEARCVCGIETYRERTADNRVRLSPYDPATARHLGQCEYVSETDPAVLKVLLKVRPGGGGGYDWVECGGCGAGWQVANYAESVG